MIVLRVNLNSAGFQTKTNVDRRNILYNAIDNTSVRKLIRRC